MNTIDWNLLMDITFKTQCYRRNFDLISTDENFITEYDGIISLMRPAEQMPPFIIGEYAFSVWDIKLGTQFGANFRYLLEEHDDEKTYFELIRLIKNKQIDILKYNKLILVHSLILRADYRKREVTEEFIEFLYRDFYCESNAIIVLVLPFQDNPIDSDYFFKSKTIPVRANLAVFNDAKEISAVEYYSLNDLIKRKDIELNEYKLFSAATRCGFNRIGESHLFIYSPEKTIERMKGKQENIKFTNII